MVKGGVDEALNANVFITAAAAVNRKMTPRFTSSVITKIFHWGVLTPIWILLGIYATGEIGMLEGIAIALD